MTHCALIFRAVMKNEIANGIKPPIHAIGDAKHAPKYPSHSTKKIAAATLITNSTIPAIVGTKLCPSPCNVNRKMNSKANAQYDKPGSLRAHEKFNYLRA